MKYTFFILIIASSLLRAQHLVPFASHDNIIELAVMNSSNGSAGQVIVEVRDVPQWLRFTSSREIIHSISPNGSANARFNFSVDRSAPVGTIHKVRFFVRSSDGELWTKEIELRVAAPQTFEVFQNFPNPFNPVTTISYLLPAESNTTVTIFDLLGKEIAILYNGEESAGYHRHLWNASTSASGVYIYQIAFTEQQGKTIFVRKKMMLTK